MYHPNLSQIIENFCMATKMEQNGQARLQDILMKWSHTILDSYVNDTHSNVENLI